MQLPRQLLRHLTTSLRVVQEKGARAGIAELGRTLRRVIYQRAEYVVVGHTLSEQYLSAAPVPGLVIRQVETRKEIAVLSSMADSTDMERFYKMFGLGSIGFIAFQSGQPAGYCWMSEKIDRSVNRVKTPLSPGDAYVHDLFASPAHRGQGIGQALVAHRLRFMREHGFKRAIAIVREQNAPALKVDKKAGYVHIGVLSHVRILFWDWFRYRNLSAV